MNEPNHPYQRLPRDQIAAVLHARGITPTQQRVEIAYVLLGQPRHMSAEQVLNQVNRGEVAVSKATVYNTLGLLREVIVDPAKVFYDSNTHPHHHFYDVSTGTLADIAGDQINIARLPELPEGTSVEGVEVIVRIRSRNP